MKVQICLSKNKASSNWKEIRGFLSNIPKNEIPYYYEAFIKTQAIDYNTEFWDEIIKSRGSLGIPPQGYDLAKIYSLDYESRQKKEADELALEKESTKIIRLMKLDPFIKDRIKSFIKGNFIGLYIPTISIGYEGFDWADTRLPDPDEPYEGYANEPVIPESVVIRIYRQMSKEKLSQSINNIWDEISQAMEEFSDKKFDMSDRDLRILEFRDRNNLPFSEIAEQIIKEFKYEGTGYEEQTNEDSMKTAYHRTKQKVNQLAHYKRK